MALTLSNTINDMRIALNQLQSDVDDSVITGINSLNDVIITSPVDGQVLVYDIANGIWINTDFTAVAGANTEVQFNDNGNLATVNTFTYDKVTETLSIPNVSTSNVVTENLNSANTATVNTLSANTATVNTATVNTLSANTATVNTATVDTLSANTATVDTLSANTATVNTATVDTLSANTATVDTLSATSITETSAEQFKKNIRSFYGAINMIDSMNPVLYEWRENDKTDYGFIAEELNEVIPELVSTKDGKIEGVHYSKITSILVQGFKEMMDYVDILNQRIKKLENN